MPDTHVLILGAGPAGYAAGIYAARAGLTTTLLTGSTPGGQLMLTHEIENYPGYTNISGADLMTAFQQQAQAVGTRIIMERAEKADLTKRPFHITTNAGTVWAADTLIIATGASPRWLHAPGEDTFRGKGISVCATCDGFFYRNKKVIIIGDGNTAAYEALFLAKVAASVTIIARGNRLTGEHNLIQQVHQEPKITIIWETEVTAFLGTEKLTGVRCRHTRTGLETTLDADGVFEAIGHIPNTQLFTGQLAMDENGYLMTQKYTGATSIAGVFAAGDCQEVVHRQAIIAAGSGAIAALSAEKFLTTPGTPLT